MTSPIPHSEESVSAPAQTAPSASNPATAAAAAQSNAPAQVTNKTKIGSLEELKKLSPKFYNQLMQSIGMSVCRSMEHHQDRLKKLMREGRERG